MPRTKVINPEYKPHLEVVANDAAWDALKLLVGNHLRANAKKSTVEIATLRALHPKLADDRIWAQLASDLGLLEVPTA